MGQKGGVYLSTQDLSFHMYSIYALGRESYICVYLIDLKHKVNAINNVRNTTRFPTPNQLNSGYMIAWDIRRCSSKLTTSGFDACAKVAFKNVQHLSELGVESGFSVGGQIKAVVFTWYDQEINRNLRLRQQALHMLRLSDQNCRILCAVQ